ncbi:MAG: pseudaminic acid biosynthesis-associated methylase [Saprospiraceae bacterium]
MSTFKTEQEQFWAGSFGNEYIQRNQGDTLLASNVHFFSKALQRAGLINSCTEFGANVGMNMKALQILYPGCHLKGIEINEMAAKELALVIGNQNVFNASIFDLDSLQPSELSLIKGVLIHLDPSMLPSVYQSLYDLSTMYILIAEYYNPVPVSISYRGHDNKLFKRDFAGEFLEKFPECTLVDYGFAYRKDPAFPQDDITWFLIKK